MRYAVIGGGVLGLTAAVRLARKGHEVRVLEQAAVPGGLASSFEVAPGIWLERFYHHLFRTDRAAIRLIDELGLGARLRWYQPASSVLVDGRPRELDSARSLLAFDPLSIADRLRMAATIATLKLAPTPRLLERSSADAWMGRACGPRGHGLVWGPLLQAKFGAAHRDVSMAWLWARIHDRTSRLGYLDGGFHQVYLALAGALERAGGTVELGAAVARIRPAAGGVEVTWSAGGEHDERFDRVVSTLSPAVTARLAGIGPEGSGGPRGPAGHAPLSAHCLVLSLDRPLTGIYWIGVGGGQGPFLAVVEHTALLPASAYGGRHLVYLGAYREEADPFSRLPTADQVASSRDLLRLLNPAFDPRWIVDAWSFHAPNAQPIVDTSFRARIPGFRTSVPGLYNATMFQVYPHDRGQNYSIELADRLVAFLDREPAAAGTIAA